MQEKRSKSYCLQKSTAAAAVLDNALQTQNQQWKDLTSYTELTTGDKGEKTVGRFYYLTGKVYKNEWDSITRIIPKSNTDVADTLQ